MAKNGTNTAERGKALPQRTAPSSLKAAQGGIRTAEDFANTMSALMADLLDGSISPEVGNAVCNAGGKLLKVVEMRLRYGSPPAKESPPDLVLARPKEEAA